MAHDVVHDMRHPLNLTTDGCSHAYFTVGRYEIHSSADGLCPQDIMSDCTTKILNWHDKTHILPNRIDPVYVSMASRSARQPATLHKKA
jgi:hypothetical protein